MSPLRYLLAERDLPPVRAMFCAIAGVPLFDPKLLELLRGELRKLWPHMTLDYLRPTRAQEQDRRIVGLLLQSKEG